MGHGKVAIIGAGLIGRSWAMVFARSGWTVALFDPVAGATDRAMALIPPALEEQACFGLVAEPEAARARIAPAPTLAAALDGAVLAQECGPEREDAKRAIFAGLDGAAAADTILASSTSGIVPSRFTTGLRGRGRCLVAHPVNPPHLIPIVELCPAPWTEPDVLARAGAIYRAVGQVPIHVRREIEGFVLNRLQGALLAEAFRLVGEGVVGPEDLDATMTEGLGLRWSLLGPFATIALNAPAGIADYCARYGAFFRRLADDPAPGSVWEEANIARVIEACGAPPDAAMHAARERERDRRLAALRAHRGRAAV